ncbi:class I SAM-dependent methyltransferase, partial [Dehalococcoidales bacterium]|nr:class I SAM-dependent methyltransferase [Dehalococcoidales bacterium]
MFKASKILTYLHYQAVSVEARTIVLNLCEKNPDTRLLDVGCGDGEITMKVAERIGTKMIWGIDIVEDSLTKAKAKGIQVVAADLNQPLPLESESFDIVHAANIIEHLSKTDIFLKEVYRVLKPGGYFIISTCNLA